MLFRSAFGVDAQAFTNDKSQFVQYASRIFNFDKADALKFGLHFLPSYLGFYILQWLKRPIFKEKETEFFYHVVIDSLKHRRESKSRRNDLIDMMVDAIRGDIKRDDQENNEEQFEKVILGIIFTLVCRK